MKDFMKAALPLTVGVALLLAGCQPRTLSGGVVETKTLWMAQSFSGGQQCRDAGETQQPDVLAPLESADIDVLETRKVTQPTCQACGTCPAYSFRHFIRIHPEDRQAAGKAGYRRSAAPEE